MQGVAVLPNPGLALVERPMRALAHLAGIAVMDKARFPDGLNHPAQGMVHHPVAKRGGADQPALGLVDIEIAVCAWLVSLAEKLQTLIAAGYLPGQAQNQPPPLGCACRATPPGRQGTGFRNCRFGEIGCGKSSCCPIREIRSRQYSGALYSAAKSEEDNPHLPQEPNAVVYLIFLLENIMV